MWFLAACAVDLPAQTADIDAYARDLREAERLLSAGRFDGVAAVLKDWPAKLPERPEASHFLGLAYYGLADYNSAIRHLSGALTREAEGSAAWRQTVEILGAAHYFANQWRQAIPLLEKAAGWQADNSDLQYTLGMSYMFTRNLDGARRVFARIFQADPDSPQAYVLTIDLMRKEGDETGVETLLIEARRKWPEFPGLASRLGAVATNQGDHARAVQLFREELKGNPSGSRSWQALGEALASHGENAEASEALKRAIWLDSRATSSYTLLAKLYMEAGNHKLAEDTLNQALKTNPQSYEANFLLGRLYHKTGRTELAKKQLEIADRIPH